MFLLTSGGVTRFAILHRLGAARLVAREPCDVKYSCILILYDASQIIAVYVSCMAARCAARAGPVSEETRPCLGRVAELAAVLFRHCSRVRPRLQHGLVTVRFP